MSEWQPIETVPKDGTEVLVCFMNNPRTGQPLITRGCWEEGFGWTVEGWTESKLAEDMGIPPTHWMPLPTPPSSSVKEAE